MKKIMDFSPANCRNCYKCVRNCPVKAIRMVHDQAQIEESRCVACGACFVVCPQNARNIVSDLNVVKASIENKRMMMASVAPSYLAVYKQPKKWLAALRLLGFQVVEETAVGAQAVTQMYKEHIDGSENKNFITSCCPSVNLLVQRYYPELLQDLLPVESPMIVHSKLMAKKMDKKPFITFIGPCISKKKEAYPYQVNGVLNAVLTFEEVDAWIQEMGIDTAALEDSFPDMSGSNEGRIYPVENGILDGLKEHRKELVQLKVSGLANCKELFDSIRDGNVSGVLVEANACEGGCINGPAISSPKRNTQEHHYRLKVNMEEAVFQEYDCYNINNDDHFKQFLAEEFMHKTPSQEQIQKILTQIGKMSKEDELNCGACGYDTCREKAIATHNGMSHSEMCVPHMRTRAERMIDTIFDNSPNVIIIMDENLHVLEFNPTAEKLFKTKAVTMLNHPISNIIDDEDFVQVKRTGENVYGKKVFYQKYGLIVLLHVLYLPKQNMYLAIMHNMTEEEKKSTELLKLKENTLEAAQNVINKQMRVAQEIASLLGETTAETKVTLTKLQKIVRGEDGEMR